ncbi:hypothetical protein WJX84_003202 [Apatococcus fuscideae]|uniref:Uncharacterized protein n=1 Tax=Apatococcus fuscideae TaxID=2026836 RepID=A0AAW1T2D5_9CHLO
MDFQPIPTTTSEQLLNETDSFNGTAQPDFTEQEAGVMLITFYVVLGVMVGAQSALFWWKKKDKRSYELVTLLGLWLVPPVISFKFAFWRFLLVWSGFSAVTGYMLWQCIQRKMGSSTPHLVYAWFLRAHQVSVAVGGIGYLLLLLELFGIGPILRFLYPPTLSIMMVWYGLYFGILGRDCAEVAADRMAAVMGGRRKMAVSKVDLRVLYGHRPWASTNLSWIQMLDAVRYLIVWNPVILIALHFLLHELGLEKTLGPAGSDGLNSTLSSNGTLGLDDPGLLNNTAASLRLF